jgi:hypothetical protein
LNTLDQRVIRTVQGVKNEPADQRQVSQQTTGCQYIPR